MSRHKNINNPSSLVTETKTTQGSHRLASEVEIFTNQFLSSLPKKLGLDRLRGLTLDNPKDALSTLIEVQSEVLRQHRATRALLELELANDNTIPKLLH